MLRVMPQNWSPNHWGEAHAHRVSEEIRRLRGSRSAQWLAGRTAELGHPVSRSVITDIENGRRRYITVSELLVIAAALDTAPIALLYPGPYDDETAEVLPHVNATELQAVQWFSGEDEPSLLSADQQQFDRNMKRLRIARRLHELEGEKSRYVKALLGPPDDKADLERRLGVHIERIVDALTAQIDELRRDLEAEYGR